MTFPLNEKGNSRVKMAVHVCVSRSSVLEKNKLKVHHLPCTIKRNGEAKVSTYFDPDVYKNGNGVLLASLRGYPLLGKEISIPENYCGIVLQEAKGVASRTSDINVYPVGSFDKFTYWNYDEAPTSRDAIVRAMNWIDIAEALHSPIDS